MPRASLGERARYAFDTSMSRGPAALIGWLTIAAGGFLALCTAVMWLFRLQPVEGPEPDVFHMFWFALMRALDPGTMGGDDGSVPFLLFTLAVTMGGIFIVSTLIGLVTSGIESRVEELRKGRSRVIEREHVVLLNWSPHVFAIVEELADAREGRPVCVVVLADRDKVDMEDTLRERVGRRRGLRIVCRTGSPLERADLDRVSVETARAVVVLGPDGAAEPDVDVIRTVLALTNGPRPESGRYHIVAELHDPANLEAARLAGRDECEFVLAGDLIARVMVQTCRQSGLSVVHTELLDFNGQEFYFARVDEVAGMAFGEALHAFPTAALVGVESPAGEVRIRPAMEFCIEPGSRVIAIAENARAVRASSQRVAVREEHVASASPAQRLPERILVLGWNWRAPRVVAGLDQYVAPGSVLTLLAEHEGAHAELERRCRGLGNLALTVVVGDTTSRPTLDALDIQQFAHIVVLCSDQVPAERADARVLVTLLHLRDIAERGGFEPSIASEMMDVRNRALAHVTRADDFIVSEKLVSLTLAQLAETPELSAVFNELFDAVGSEIHLKPAASYVTLDVPVSFATVVESARRQGEVAIGFRVGLLARVPEEAYGVVLNPAKAAEHTFTTSDRVIVVAER